MLDGVDVTITMKRKDGEITVSVSPNAIKVMQPAILTGTPDELDSDFFSKISPAITHTKGVVDNLQDYKKSLEEASEEEKENAEKPKGSKKPKGAKKDAPKKEGTPEPEPKEQTKPAVEQQSIFGQ